MSPAIVPKVPFTTPKIKTDVEINEAARFCVQLHHDDFFDLGRMVKTAPSKRRKILAKAILLELGPYDPSDDFVINYKGTEIIELYKKLTEMKLDKTTSTKKYITN